jgi:Ca2+-binding RTX toxin-like protein
MSITPWSAVIPVAATTSTKEYRTSSAQLTDGTIVVTYFSTNSPIVSFQRFTDTGVAIGNPVATGLSSSFSSGNNPDAPRVTALTDGGFVFVYQESTAVRAQKYLASGVANGGPITIDAASEIGDVAAMPNSQFVVAHGQKITIVQANGVPFGAIDTGFPATDIDVAVSATRIAYIHDSDGVDVGINSYDLIGNDGITGPNNVASSGTIGANAIATLSTGGFVGVFEKPSLSGAGSSIHAIITKSDGSTQNLGVQLADNLNVVFGLDVQGLANGGFAIAYAASAASIGLVSEFGIYVRVFNADGSSAGGELVIERTDPSLGMTTPDLTTLRDGRLLVTWTELDNFGAQQDTRMQILDPRDGVYVGTGDADKIYGHDANNDNIHGAAGADTIYGLRGNDTIYGDAGADTLYGGRGDDDVYGGADGDIIYGDLGDDQLFGGDGNDVIYSFGGADLMDGGAGTGDSVFYVNERSAVTINLVDQILNAGAAFGDTIVNIERIYGAVYFANNLTGDNNSNILVGGIQSDIMNGGGGFDILRGGLGADTMTGGTSGDYFQYTAVAEGGDTITDWAAGDKFTFARAAFGNLVGANVAAVNFLSVASGHVATTAAQKFIFDQATDQLWYDADGSAGGAAVFVADITTNYNILNTDLLLA